MIAASARRESTNYNSSVTIATPSRASLVGIRERLQANQRDIERFNQMRRRRRWERQTSFRKDLCRRISKGLIIPTGLVVGTSVIITSCSCISPIGRGTIFWESPHRNHYRIIGSLLLLCGALIMWLNYMLYKLIRTGDQRRQRELDIINHECHLCRGLKSRERRTKTDNFSMESDLLLVNNRSRDLESGSYDNSTYHTPQTPFLSRSGQWIGPKTTQVGLPMNDQDTIFRDRGIEEDFKKYINGINR